MFKILPPRQYSWTDLKSWTLHEFLRICPVFVDGPLITRLQIILFLNFCYFGSGACIPRLKILLDWTTVPGFNFGSAVLITRLTMALTQDICACYLSVSQESLGNQDRHGCCDNTRLQHAKQTWRIHQSDAESRVRSPRVRDVRRIQLQRRYAEPQAPPWLLRGTVKTVSVLPGIRKRLLPRLRLGESLPVATAPVGACCEGWCRLLEIFAGQSSNRRLRYDARRAGGGDEADRVEWDVVLWVLWMEEALGADDFGVPASWYLQDLQQAKRDEAREEELFWQQMVPKHVRLVVRRFAVWWCLVGPGINS